MAEPELLFSLRNGGTSTFGLFVNSRPKLKHQFMATCQAKEVLIQPRVSHYVDLFEQRFCFRKNITAKLSTGTLFTELSLWFKEMMHKKDLRLQMKHDLIQT